MVTTTWDQKAGMTSPTDTDNLENYAEQAEASKDAAAASETAAATSATAAAGSATAAAGSSSAASTSATAANASASSAASSATAASGSASSATTSATAASASQTAAAASEAGAATSATNAATSATSASGSASSASTDASAASTSATASAASATAASASETNASASETAAASSAAASASSATDAAASETAAAASETAAASSEAAAATSASAASTSAANAAASETNSASSATAAASSATSASASADAALAALDSFDDRYLGQKASDPALDNDGNALVAGALYFNTTDDIMKVYDGSVWVAAYASLSGALLQDNNLSDVLDVAASRTNLGLGTAATTASTDYATAAQGTLADSAVQPNDTPTFAGLTTTDHVSFGDNDKAIFGAGNDLEIYHSGTTSYIRDVGEGDLQIFATDDVFIRGYATNNYMARFNENGAVTLYHNNAQKLTTTSTGISVTGNAKFADNDKAIFGAGNDLEIYHDGSNSWIRDSGAGELVITTDGGGMQFKSNGSSEQMLRLFQDGPVQLYYDNALKLATTSTGVDVTGTITSDGLTVSNDAAGIADAIELENFSGESSYIKAKRGLTLSADYDNNSSAAQSNITFETDASERMRIDSSGKVGIRTASPDAFLTVKGQTVIGSLVAESANLTNLTSGTPPQLIAGWSVPAITWSPASSTEAVFTRDGHMQIDILAGANGFSTINFSDPDDEDVGQVSYAHSTDSMIFRTNNAERMRIDSSGNLLVGTTSGSDKVTVNGTVSATNFNTTSDATLKTNVETLTGSLDAVNALRGVSFDWIESGGSEVGFIAQEVEEVLPEVVSTNDQGIKSVKYGNMVAVLVEALKEQQLRIEALEAKLGE